MKKIVKLFGIMTIAAALLVSCKPTTEDPTNPGEGTTDSGTNSEAQAPAENPGNDNTGDETPKTFSYSVDFTKAKVKDDYCTPNNPVVPNKDAPVKAEDGTIVIGAAEDGALQIAGYSWDSYKISFDAVDLSKAKKVTITAKTGADYTAPDAIIFEYASGDKAVGASAWTDSSFLKLTAEYADYSLSLDKFSDLSGDSNSKYTGGKLEDRKAVNSVTFNPRGAKGQIYIKSIVFSE